MKYKFKVSFLDINENLLDVVIVETQFVEDALEMAVKTNNYIKLEGKVNLVSIYEPQEEVPLSPPLLELSIEEVPNYLKIVNSKVKRTSQS